MDRRVERDLLRPAIGGEISPALIRVGRHVHGDQDRVRKIKDAHEDYPRGDGVAHSFAGGEKLQVQNKDGCLGSKLCYSQQQILREEELRQAG